MQEVPGVRKRELIATILVLVLGLVVGACSGESVSPSTSVGATTSTFVGAGTSSDSTTAIDSSTDSSTTTTTEAATSTTVAGKTVRYQQGDARFKYAGTWKTSSNGAASGGTYAFANSSGCKVTITFEGTHLSLIAKKSPKYGKAMVTLDGKKLGTIDFYNTDAKYQQKVWGTSQLVSGTHTVVIEWTGTKRKAATDTNISIDAVVVTLAAE